MILSVHVQPGASTEGLRWDEVRGWVLRVRARPVEGAANARVREFVAEALGVKPARVSLRSGEHARQKVLDIDGDDAVLTEALRALRSA